VHAAYATIWRMTVSITRLKASMTSDVHGFSYSCVLDWSLNFWVFGVKEEKLILLPVKFLKMELGLELFQSTFYT
jgi:hypothetical protein